MQFSLPVLSSIELPRSRSICKGIWLTTPTHAYVMEYLQEKEGSWLLLLFCQPIWGNGDAWTMTHSGNHLFSFWYDIYSIMQSVVLLKQHFHLLCLSLNTEKQNTLKQETLIFQWVPYKPCGLSCAFFFTKQLLEDIQLRLHINIAGTLFW